MNETYSEGDPLVFPNPPKTFLTVQTPADAEYVVIRPPIDPGSDLGELVMLLARAGYVEEKLAQFSSGKKYQIDHDPAGVELRAGLAMTSPTITSYWHLTLPEGIGYHGFMCCFYFDLAGALLHHGVWE